MNKAFSHSTLSSICILSDRPLDLNVKVGQVSDPELVARLTATWRNRKQIEPLLG